MHFRVIGRDAGGNEIRSQMVDVEFGEGSGEDGEGFFSGTGSIAASGILVVVLVVVLVALFLRNRDAKQELRELQDRFDKLEGDAAHLEDEGEFLLEGSEEDIDSAIDTDVEEP